MSEGISVRGIGHQILSNELFQEVTIMSDMYNLNEYMALDLLCTAQIQLSYHPGLTRGLVAVLLYYDGRKALVSSLKLLMQARQGVLWRIDIADGVAKYITDYTNDLLNNGVFNRVLELLKSMDTSKEIELLQKNRALGNPKHHRQVLDLFEEIRQELADIVYMWAAQTGLPRGPAINLISYLRTLKPEEDAFGGIDNISLTLEMALLYALDLSILHIREDGEEMVNSLPLISENGLMKLLIEELSPAKGKWECEGLQALATLALGECLATVRLLPHNQNFQLAVEHEDDTDCAVNMNVFDFIYRVFLKNNLIYKRRFFYHRMHTILTDFIVLMQTKVKDLRIRADETSRTLQAYAQEGLEAPANLPRHFEQFLYCIATLYNKDLLQMNLMLQYWCPSEITLTQTPSYRTPPRSVSLFKFVKMAGDMMPPSLFVPYLTMLSSLSMSSQSARYCFNLLKQNGAGYATTISWDHFFGTFNRYLCNLRQETPPVSDTVYRPMNFPRGITPQEIQGLHSVLLLIRTVAEHDDFSRVAMCEHPAWAPLSILLGLVTCSVPIPFKAALLSTLAALSKSPETAAQMWNNLEASQILVTVPSTSSYQPRGIQTELDEVESRNEEYPLLRSLLELLDVLIDTGIPRTLGAGPRKPGFDPYLTFIVNSVFLKFHTRAYRNVEEKWQVARACLKLFDKFLHQYNPQASDFPVGNQPPDFNPPPGYHLMIQLHTKSQFLDLLLYIIDEGTNMFDSYAIFPGREHLEKCTLYCLNILYKALMLKPKFFGLLSNCSCKILLTSLSKLLLNINPRTSKPDYVIKIIKFISYQSAIPQHALVATKVLTQLTQQPAVHSQIMEILLSYTELEMYLRWGFVLCLDADEDWHEKSSKEDIITSTKEAIINLMKQCLSHPSPNLTHWLMGYDVKRDVSKTIFQFPGVCNFPRTCLHSLFCLMNSVYNKHGIQLKPTLIEVSYSLLYSLCDNPKTYGPMLKFIKQSQDFFQKHVNAITVKSNFSTSELNQISWLLKTIAIEQKICSGGNQIFYLKHLTKLLVGYPHVIEVKDKDNIDNIDSLQATVNGVSVSRKNLLKDLISTFDFGVTLISTPQWDYFDNSIMEKLIVSCEMGKSPRLINVKKLHQTLIDELTTLQGTAAASQRQLILQEIQKVLSYAIRINNMRQHQSASVRFMDAWRQLVQIIFVTLPSDVMSMEEQQTLLIELLETLLNKMLSCEVLPEVGTLASSAVLLLMDCLRKSHIKSLQRKKVMSQDDSDRLFVQNIIYSNTSSLKFMLHSILQWIIISGVSSQKLRVNLYGSLLSYLHLISVGYEEKPVPQHSSFYVSRLDNPEYELNDDRILISADVLSSFGDKLIEVLCHDCIGGHDICKMLAMASINRFITLNIQVNWITFISAKGFLKHLIDSLLNSDNDLKSVLETVPDTFRSIYLYETKMSLMARIGSTRVGAEVLLEQRLLACLASMKVFDDHPKVDMPVANVMESLIPSVESRYQQILLPALDLCDAILTSLGTDNRAAVAQVMYFLLSHLEVVENVLQQGRPNMSASFLKELAIITGNYKSLI